MLAFLNVTVRRPGGNVTRVARRCDAIAVYDGAGSRGRLKRFVCVPLDAIARMVTLSTSEQPETQTAGLRFR
ncbi:MAG: hypothetical protein ACLSTO_01010 [Bilophila wadsworthia]